MNFLTWSIEDGEVLPRLVCARAAGELQRRIENAGRSFFATYEKGEEEPSSESSSSAPSSEKEDAEGDDEEEKWSAKHKKKKFASSNRSPPPPSKLKVLIEGPNLYEVLGIPDNAPPTEIKKAYRKAVLDWHPDKLASGPLPTRASAKLQKLSSKEMFLLIQSAYEVLIDANQRKIYDNNLPFDETIPTSAEISSPKSFFEVLTPVFQRNGKWSNKTLPSLGTPETDIETVKRFYDCWRRFQTTRDFAVADEYDVNQAECREERRWMEKENQKIRKKLIIKENQRIATLVGLAFEHDPRIAADKALRLRRRQEVEEEEKLRLSAAKEKLERERAARAAEEQKAKEEEAAKAAQAAEERRLAKNELRIARQQIRTLAKDLIDGGLCSSEEVDEICLSLAVEPLRDFYTQLLAADPPGRERLIKDTCGGIKQRELERLQELEKEEERRRQEQRAASKSKEDAKANQKSAVSWSPEELGLLAKAVQKFPGGTHRRWECISQYVGSKTAEEVLEKTRQLSDKAVMKSMPSQVTKQAYDVYVRSLKGTRDIGAAADTRDPADLQKSGEPTEETGWTTGQQSALENALRVFPASLPPKERWASIAGQVQGKTAKECLARFKEIRATLLKQQQKSGRASE